MKTIWKFPLETECLMMPRGAEVLTVQTQRGRPCFWALVDPAMAQEPRQFRVIGTGWDIPNEDIEALRYIGTFQQPDGLVFHVFEVRRAAVAGAGR